MSLPRHVWACSKCNIFESWNILSTCGAILRNPHLGMKGCAIGIPNALPLDSLTISLWTYNYIASNIACYLTVSYVTSILELDFFYWKSFSSLMSLLSVISIKHHIPPYLHFLFPSMVVLSMIPLSNGGLATNYILSHWGCAFKTSCAPICWVSSTQDTDCGD